MKQPRILFCLIFLWAIALPHFLWAGTLGEPDGFRMENYRAPVPHSLDGATVIDTPIAQKLIAEGAAAIDTTPVLRTGYTDLTGQWNVVETRLNIPGSLWLPNVGYGQLDDGMNAYFRENLALVSDGNFDHPLIFYCYPDCWMSWNAAKRALILGYRQVYWFPDGSAGWQAAGLPLVQGVPQALFEGSDQ